MLNLNVTLSKADELIKGRLDERKKIRPVNVGRSKGFVPGDVVRWLRATIYVLEEIYGEDNKHVNEFKSVELTNPTGYESLDAANILWMNSALLLAYLDEIKIFADNPEFRVLASPVIPSASDENYYLNRIFNKFHLIATQLKDRRKGKEPFLINNETDVQDLLRALMTPVFEDIRIDEPTPSCAGKYAKMDFTIKEKQIVIETKFVSDSHLDDKIGDELIADITRYKQSKNCSILICFIYDPLFQLKKASSLKNDLEELSAQDLDIKVVIMPKS